MAFGVGSASGGGVDVSGELERAADQVADGSDRQLTMEQDGMSRIKRRLALFAMNMHRANLPDNDSRATAAATGFGHYGAREAGNCRLSREKIELACPFGTVRDSGPRISLSR